jgi:hypothetical protein
MSEDKFPNKDSKQREAEMTTRFNTSSNRRSAIQCRFDNAISLAMELRRVISAELVTSDGFPFLEAAIEAMPIAADEYAWLCTRIRNASCYVAEREFSAAGYELTLLANRLRTRASLLRG